MAIAFRQLLTGRIARFAVVGVCNALLSFGLLNLMFYTFHQGKIVSSIVATTCALIFSFYMNRGFVFSDKNSKVRKQLPAFVIVTVTGSLLLLNLVYILSIKLLAGHEQVFISPIRALTGISFRRSFIDINVSTVIGAAAALFWNYNGYRLFVFKGKHPSDDEDIQLTV